MVQNSRTGVDIQYCVFLLLMSLVTEFLSPEATTLLLTFHSMYILPGICIFKDLYIQIYTVYLVCVRVEHILHKC